jgi:putative nucleotidyltransferase with HDIG domain
MSAGHRGSVGSMQLASQLVERAQKLAHAHLPQLGNRWLHVQAVAARANALRASVSERDQDLLIAAAWLHDIGYARDAVDTGFHPLDGARFLVKIGLPVRLVCLVAHHSCARYEATERGLESELAEYLLEDGPVMDALVCADMTTGPVGEALAFAERIDEILVRYAPESPVHRAIARARSELAGSVARTHDRLESAATTTDSSIGP